MPAEPERCDGCRFWRKLTPAEGECRRYPPQAMPAIGQKQFVPLTLADGLVRRVQSPRKETLTPCPTTSPSPRDARGCSAASPARSSRTGGTRRNWRPATNCWKPTPAGSTSGRQRVGVPVHPHDPDRDNAILSRLDLIVSELRKIRLGQEVIVEQELPDPEN